MRKDSWFRGPLLRVLLVAAAAFAPTAVGAEDEDVECPDPCSTIIVKGEPYKFPSDWLHSPGGIGWRGPLGMDSVGAGIANLPTPYEMLVLKESARKAACHSMQERVLQLTGGRGFFQALERFAKEAGKKFVKGGTYWSGVLLTAEILIYFNECPDFWGGTTYHHTDGIG